MIPRIVVAGTQSGAGKTTITSGLMKALADRGLKVQGFKTGPDYIDPQCHRWATGRPGRNLDTWLMTPEQIAAGLRRGANGADIAVIEGVMGLYDGASGGSEIGSTAYLAKMLQAPVILVLDARASARSAAAVALGFKLFDPDINLAGVICNQVGSEIHDQMLREALDSVGIPMLGALMRNGELGVAEDRLGLALPGGEEMLPDWIRRAGEAVATQVDLEKVLDLAGSAPELPVREVLDEPLQASLAGRFAGTKVAVGLDPAFWFYYEETFDLMRHWGAEPVFFSPMADQRLPEGVSGLYLGGGFPERHAPALAANQEMREAIRSALAAGMPALGECGGYLYLLEGLTGEDGQEYPMVGAIPGVARLQPRLQGMGYRTAEPGGVRGHVFHYTRVEESSGPTAWELSRSNGSFDRADGFRRGAILASYLHVHHATQPRVMEEFLQACKSHASLI